MLDMVWHLKQVEHARLAHGRIDHSHHTNSCSQRYFFEYKIKNGLWNAHGSTQVEGSCVCSTDTPRENYVPNHAEITRNALHCPTSLHATIVAYYSAPSWYLLQVWQTLNSACYTWHYPTLARHGKGEIHCEVCIVREHWSHVHSSRFAWQECKMACQKCVYVRFKQVLFDRVLRVL